MAFFRFNMRPGCKKSVGFNWGPPEMPLTITTLFHIGGFKGGLTWAPSMPRETGLSRTPDVSFFFRVWGWICNLFLLIFSNSNIYCRKHIYYNLAYKKNQYSLRAHYKQESQFLMHVLFNVIRLNLQFLDWIVTK